MQEDNNERAEEKYKVQNTQEKSRKNGGQNMLNASTKAQGSRTNWQFV